MNTPAPGEASGLVTRVKAILFQPKDEWPIIAAEPATNGEILMRYAVPLAAIGPVATFLGGQVFGYGAFGFSYRPGFMGALGTLVISYVLSLVGLFILAAIANFLAPKFAGEGDNVGAFKLVAYSATAAWVAGVFALIPSLAFLSILGLYSLYLFYTGAAPLMKVPQEKALGYTAVTFLAAIVLYLVAGAVIGLLIKPFGGLGSNIAVKESASSGSVTVPGLGSINVGEVEKAAKRMEDAASGKTKPADAAALQALLPASIAGFAKIAMERTAIGGMGNAEATYASGEHSFKLKITDTNALGALAGMGMAMGMEQSREDADGYDRTGVVDGRLQMEQWSKSGSRGKFGMILEERFLVEAEGNVPSIDVLKGAVAEINARSLAALAQ